MPLKQAMIGNQKRDGTRMNASNTNKCLCKLRRKHQFRSTTTSKASSVISLISLNITKCENEVIAKYKYTDGKN